MMWTCAEAARNTNTDYHQLYRWIQLGRVKGARKCKKSGNWWLPTTVLAKPANLDIYVPIEQLKRISYRPPTPAQQAARQERLARWRQAVKDGTYVPKVVKKKKSRG